MSHFWPFCFLIRPSLNHIHLCSFCYSWQIVCFIPSVLRETWAAISPWPPLSCTQDNFFSTASTPPLHVRVWAKNLQYFPIFMPNYYNPLSNLLSSLKRYTADDWEAVWSYWITQSCFFFHAAWPTDCRSQAMSTQGQGSALCVYHHLVLGLCHSLMKVFCMCMFPQKKWAMF